VQANDLALLNQDIGGEYVLEWVDVADPDAAPVVVVNQPGGVTLGLMPSPTFTALTQGCMRVSRGKGAVWDLELATMQRGILLCEDGGTGSAGASRLLGLDPGGAAYEFCRNNQVLDATQIANAGKLVNPGSYLGSEFCGACFDPKGLVLFVSLQSPGITFAIREPWKSGNL
jgi:hypothetical protein